MNGILDEQIAVAGIGVLDRPATDLRVVDAAETDAEGTRTETPEASTAEGQDVDDRPRGLTPASELSLIDLVGEDEDEAGWQERALCAQTDPEAFFPEKGGSTREAKKVCVSCDVRAECLEYALANDERFGIWGGLSERERRRLKKAAV